MATRSRNRRKFEWVRAAGTLHAAGNPAGAGGTFDVNDLFGNVKAEFNAQGDLTDVTVTVVRGYVRPTIGTVGAGETTVQGRVGIRVCELGDVQTGTPENHGPGYPGETDFGSYLDWMGYMPWMLDPTSLDSQQNPPASWHSPACPWHVDVESARRIKTRGQTLGIFSESIAVPTGGDAFTNPVFYDLSIGIRLP